MPNSTSINWTDKSSNLIRARSGNARYLEFARAVLCTVETVDLKY
jgi:hypothetical protein